MVPYSSSPIANRMMCVFVAAPQVSTWSAVSIWAFDENGNWTDPSGLPPTFAGASLQVSYGITTVGRAWPITLAGRPCLAFGNAESMWIYIPPAAT